ncbi:MAG: hypothetical protein J3R72DRAFT_428295 [Linnemannia gamsii]|nr:MAG: hypothetical protein J3R72DRAFT_428295 [Linnemannia gamsii]
MPLRALTSKSALATTATSSSSSATSTTSPFTPADNAPAILTPATSGGRKIRITSSCNYTKPIIRLNLRNLDPESVPASTSTPSPLTPSPLSKAQPPKAQSSKVQPTPSPAPASAPFTPQPSVLASSSSSSAPTTTPIPSQPTQKTTPSPKPAITTTVATRLTTSTSEHTGSNCSTNSSSSISPSLAYDCDLSETAMAGNDEEQDPDPDFHHRRQPQRNRLIRSRSSSPLTKYLIHNNNSHNSDDNSREMGSDDPFKELGLKPYSPIWLPSRTPSFDRLMRDDGDGGDGDQLYSVSSRHHETFHDQNHQVDRELLKGFDLHESTNNDGNVDREIISNIHNRKDPMMGSSSSISKDRLDNAGNEGESIPLKRYHRYERFGSVRKRPHSPLVPDHFDDLEDKEYDAPLHPALPSQGPSSADARMNEMPNKRPKYDAVEPDQSQDQAQGKAAAHLPPQDNSQAGTEGGDIVASLDRNNISYVSSGQGPSYFWSGIRGNDHHHPQPYGSQRFPPHPPHPQNHPEQHHQYQQQQQQQDKGNFNNSHSYDHHDGSNNHPPNTHMYHPSKHPYQPRPWNTYRNPSYHSHQQQQQHYYYNHYYPQGGFQVQHENVGEDSNWFHGGDDGGFYRGRGRGRRGGRGRGHGRGRGRGRGRGWGRGGIGVCRRYPFLPDNSMDHRHQFEDEGGPFFNGHSPPHPLHGGPNGRHLYNDYLNSTGTTGTRSDPSSASPPPLLPVPRLLIAPVSPSLLQPQLQQAMITPTTTDSLPSSSLASAPTSHIPMIIPHHHRHPHNSSNSNNNISVSPRTDTSAINGTNINVDTTYLPPVASNTTSASTVSLQHPQQQPLHQETATSTLSSSSSASPRQPLPLSIPSISPSTTSHTNTHSTHSISHSNSHSRSRSHSHSGSRSKSPSPTSSSSSSSSLAHKIRRRRRLLASSDISALATKLLLEPSLYLQAQKQIRMLKQTVKELEDQNQWVEKNYEELLGLL